MRIIEGLVCDIRTRDPKQELLFGPNIEDSGHNYQNFISNGLTPFKMIADAQEALKSLRKRRNSLNIYYSSISKVRLDIASTEEDIKKIQGSRKLILVAELDFGQMILLGRKVEGIRGLAYDPVSNLELNGFITIKNFNLAVWALQEVRRQSRPINSYLATFEKTKVKLT